MFIIDDTFHGQVVSAYHQYLRNPVAVDLTPDEYVDRPDYVSASSLGRCPKAYAMRKKELPKKLPELDQDESLASLMRMRAGTEAGITFASAMKTMWPKNVKAEKYLHDEVLKVHGFADVIFTDDIGQTAIIEVKKRAGYFNSPSEPRISDIYQLLTYGLIYSKAHSITARMFLVLIDGGETYPVHVYELAPVQGGYEVRDLFHQIVDDFTGELIQKYTLWESDSNSPMFLNYYETTTRINSIHEWLSMDAEQLEMKCPIPDPVNSRVGFQCIRYMDGKRPKPNKVKPVTAEICAACPFSCHFTTSLEKRTVLIAPDGRGEVLED